MHRICLTAALVAASALGSIFVAPERAVARRHSTASLSGTGLRAIALAHAPPDFAFRAASGVVHLRELVGAPVVVNFWATWCEPCQAELETFARLRSAYGARVTLLAISAEAPGVARAYLAARHIAATAVDDDEHRIADLYGVSAIPVTIVLDPAGAVAHVSVGELDWSELRGAIDPFAAEAPDTVDLTR